MKNDDERFELLAEMRLLLQQVNKKLPDASADQLSAAVSFTLGFLHSRALASGDATDLKVSLPEISGILTMFISMIE